MPVSRTSAAIGRRACAVLAACSAVLHGLMVGDAGNVAVSVFIVGMALACLYCARELWTAGSPRVWCIVAVMNLGMVAVHWTMPGHHHGQAVALAPTVMQPTQISTLMVVATSISIVEAAIATAVLWFQTRSRASSFSLAARNRGAI